MTGYVALRPAHEPHAKDAIRLAQLACERKAQRLFPAHEKFKVAEDHSDLLQSNLVL